MKKLLICLFLILAVKVLPAQKPLADSTMKEFVRLTCECATLMKIDEGLVKDGFRKLSVCINGTLGIYQGNGWIKKEWLSDSVWVANFDNELQDRLDRNCPVFKTLMERSNPKADIPEPMDVTPEKYFLTAESMTKKGMEINPNATLGTMRRWSAKNMTGSTIQMVFDIRMIFKNEADAAAYFKAKLEEMSEGGELTKNKLEAEGTDESRVYSGNPKLMGAFGDLDLSQYNFIFRIKNVIAKVFLSTSKKATYPEALVFPREAIGRIKAAL